MELERLEVVFDGDISPLEEKIAQLESRFDERLGKLKDSSSRNIGSVEKDFAGFKGFDKFTKQLEQMNTNFEKQFSKMKQSSGKQGESIGNEMAAGMSKGTVKMNKDIQTAVDSINLKMQKAKAAQAKLAQLQSDRNGAQFSGNGKAASTFDAKIAQAQIQMNQAQQQAQAIARGLKAEYDAIPSSLDVIAAKMSANESKIEAMRAKVKALNAEMQNQMKDTGGFNEQKLVSTPNSEKTAAKIGTETGKMNKLIADNDRLNQSYARMEDRSKSLKAALSGVNTKLGDVSSKTKMASNGMNNLSGLTNKTSNLFGRFKNTIASSIGKFGSLFNRQSKSVVSGTNQMRASTGAFAQSMRYLLPSLVVYQLLGGAIRSMVSTLFSAMRTNSQFSSSLNQIKANLATAFYPIYQAVMPAINTLMSGLAKLTGYLASFISMLFGVNIGDAFSGAQDLSDSMAALEDSGGGATEEIADGMDNANKKAKKLKQLLMGFDEINTLQFDDGEDDDVKSPDAGKGGAGGIDWGAAQVPETPKWLEDFAKKFKDIMAKLFDPIKKAWDAQGEKVMAAFKYALSEIGKAIAAIGKSFMEVWTNGTGQLFVENLLILLTSVLNLIGDIARAFREAWEEDGRGTALIQSIFDALNRVLELLHSITEAFRNAWNNNDLGKQIIANMLEILTSIFNTVANLAEGFKKAWDEGKTGESIFTTILTILNNALTSLNKMAKATEEWAGKLNFTPLLTSIDNLLKSIEPLTKNIGAGIEWFYTNVLLPLAGYAIEEAIPAFLDLLSGALDVLNSIVEALKPSFTWLWDNLLKPIAEWTGGVIVDVLKSITEKLKEFSEWIDNNQETVASFVAVVGTFAGTLAILSSLSGVIATVQGIFTALSMVKSFAGAFTLVQYALSSIVGLLGGPVVLAIAAVAGAFILAYTQCEPFREFINNLLADIKNFAEKIYNEYIKPAIDEVIRYFQESLEKIKAFWKEHGDKILLICKTALSILWAFIEPWLKALSSLFKTIFTGIANLIKIAWDTIKGILDGAFKIIGGVVKTFTGLLTGDFGTAWEGIKDIFSGAWEIISSGFSGFVKGLGSIAKTILAVLTTPIIYAINTIISGINWVLNAVNAGFNIDKLAYPQYAKGTDYHPGGPAVVNDAPGASYREMFKLPDGRMGMFPKQRNLLVDLPRGSQVLPGNMVPNYAGGIFGTFKDFFTNGFDTVKGIADDVWNVISNPSALVEQAMDMFVNFSGLLEPVFSIAKGVLSSATDAVVGMVVDTINNFTGFADGGLVDKHGWYQMAEGNSPEMILPLNKPQRALQLMNDAFDFMGIEGVPDLTIPDVFKDTSDSQTGSFSSNKSNQTLSASGNGLAGLNTSLMETLGSTLANAVTAALANTGNINAGTSEPIQITLELDRHKFGDIVISSINDVTHRRTKFPLDIPDIQRIYGV